MLARRREHCQGSMQPELAQLMFGHGGGDSLVLGEPAVSLRLVTSNVVEHLLRVNQHIDCDAICRLSM